ncbi:MAG: adenylate/guanylate cyclase domain-containing protein [Magnetococcales bacterium]|nr:adenylate/guanylate cyclase domain-containing protein [Magnetococcales bacterium]
MTAKSRERSDPPHSLQQVSFALRLRLHLLPAVAVFFLALYGQVVCPFMDDLSFTRILSGLGLVFLGQVAVREVLFLRFPQPPSGISAARHGYRMSLLSWLLAGVGASVIHAALYADFPWVSHLKLLAGYWGLGAGVLAQWEYLTLEDYFRSLEISEQRLGFPKEENITRRLMEGFAVASLVPVSIMILMSFRFVYEGFTDKGAALEVLFLGLFFVISSLFVAWRYGRSLRQDCDHLMTVLEKVGQGEFRTSVDASRADELGRMADGIGSMMDGLAQRERIREAFGRFVNPEVAERFLKEQSEKGATVTMGGKRRELTVLMCDLRGFTPMAEKMDPEQLTETLNSYLTEMVIAIRNHGGMVDKFIGDAVLAVFGLAGTDHDHTVSAIHAAQEMRHRLHQFNASRGAASPTLEHGIGVHVGEVIAGYVGSPDRLEFTVIGHTVNVAARIESHAKAPNPPLLFSDAVASRIRAAGGHVKEVRAVSLKGVSSTMQLYTLNSETPEPKQS